MSIVALLQQNALFSRASPSHLEALAARFHPRNYRAGQIVFHQGDPGLSLYVIESGTARVLLTSEDGREAVVALLGPGDIFGELSLLDGQPRSATVQAVTEMRAHVLDRGAFLEFLSTHADVALAVSTALASRLRQADERLAQSIFLDLPSRLGRYILQIATSGEKTHQLEVAANQRQLAETVGASRQSVNRILGQWERLGLVRRRSRGLVLLQPERLRRLVF